MLHFHLHNLSIQHMILHHYVKRILLVSFNSPNLYQPFTICVICNFAYYLISATLKYTLGSFKSYTSSPNSSITNFLSYKSISYIPVSFKKSALVKATLCKYCLYAVIVPSCATIQIFSAFN